MAVTAAVLGEALRAVGAGSRLVRPLDELAAGADAALRQTPPGLTAPGAAALLATTAQESAYYRTTREYGSGQRYAPWIGRGFVQCTWKENYAAFGRWAHAHGLVDDPGLFLARPSALEEYRYAWATAVWYFEETRLWEWANAGDFRRVSQAVNGGRGKAGTAFTPHGWRERVAMFEAFMRAGRALLPDGVPAPASARGDLPMLREGDSGEHVRRLQAFLRKNFRAYAGRLVVDGKLGPATRRACEQFQGRVTPPIPTTPPFGWGEKSWAAARRHGFPD